MPVARSVLVVEPDERRRAAAVSQIERIAGYPVVCACAGRRQMQRMLREPIDFALINMQLPDGSGAELIRIILKRNPHCRVLVLTDVAEEKTVMQAVLAGACGYMLFSDEELDIRSCFEMMAHGGSPISQPVSIAFLRALACRGQAESPPEGSPLSSRETEVLRLMARGANTEEIGQLLAVSRNTVITHAKSIYRKLDVHSRSEAIAAARSLGFLP